MRKRTIVINRLFKKERLCSAEAYSNNFSQRVNQPQWHSHLVSTLLGFPFPQGKAIIYKITPAGQVSVFQQGFTTLVDIVPGNTNGHLVAQHGNFVIPTGFAKHTGRLVWANGQTITPFVTDLNLPVGIAQVNNHTWYVTSLGDKSVLKVTYE